MGKTKLILIFGGVLAAVLTAMLLLILRLGEGMERTLLCVCWVVSLLVFFWLIVWARRLGKDYTFWSQRYEADMSANSDELANKASEIASYKTKIEKMTRELERLSRLNANYEGMVSHLRRESGSAQDKLDECCKLLADVRERAEQSDKMKASFLANVTHELRTPLNSVLGYGAIINNPSISEERRRHFMQVLQKSCDRFLDTLNDMLYYSQLQSGDVNITTNVFEVGAMLCSLRVMALDKIKESGKNINLVFDNDLSGKSYFCGFEAGYYKILSILLDNAVKFTNEGRITVHYESVGTSVRFEVSDTGIGFDQRKKDLIFGSFNQSEATLSRQYEGIGLGLSICKSLVSLMNGTMDAEGHPGAGSKFSFEVPLLNTPTNDLALYDKVEKMLAQYNDRGAIMVMSPYVEDYDFVNIFFGSYGIDVVRCRSLEEVEVLADTKRGLSIAIIDLSTSPADGFAAAGAVFHTNPKVRFAFVRGAELDEGSKSKTGLYTDLVIQRPLSSKSLCKLLSVA